MKEHCGLIVLVACLVILGGVFNVIIVGPNPAITFIPVVAMVYDILSMIAAAITILVVVATEY